MKNEKTQYKVDIFGEQFVLVSDESAEHVFNAARLVDSLMREIAAKAPHAEAKKIAVLASLQMANQLGSLKNEVEKNKQKETHLAHLIDTMIDAVDEALDIVTV